MILFGASGHAKVIIDILFKQDIAVPYLLDDNQNLKELKGIRVVTYSSLLDLSEESLIISIGDNEIRKLIKEKLTVQFGRAIHPTSILDQTVRIEEGTVIMAGVIINSGTLIGKHVIVNTAASIDHDCIIEDFAHISPNATLCGSVKIGEGTHIGAGATIIPNITIGKWVTVGAGAVVINDIPDGVTVVGSPARIISELNDRR